MRGLHNCQCRFSSVVHPFSGSVIQHAIVCERACPRSHPSSPRYCQHRGSATKIGQIYSPAGPYADASSSPYILILAEAEQTNGFRQNTFCMNSVILAPGLLHQHFHFPYLLLLLLLLLFRVEFCAPQPLLHQTSPWEVQP